MIARFAPCVAVLLLVAGQNHAAPAPAGDPAIAFKPTATIRLAPPEKILAEIRATAELISRFAPTEREAKEFINGTDNALEKALGPDWHKAIDEKRPLFGYVNIAQKIESSTYCLLIPVKDESNFRAVLGRLVPKVDDPKDGLFQFELPGPRPPSGMPAYGYLRFANKYAYLTINDSTVLDANRIPTPEQIVAGDPSAPISVKVHMDRVPEQYRQMAVNGVAQFKEMIQGGGVGGGPGGRRSPIMMGGMEMMLLGGQYFQLYSLAEPVVRDGQELTLNVRYDRSKLDMTLDIAIKSANGSELSKMVANIKPQMSLFPQMVGSDTAARMLVRGTFPEDLRRLLTPKLEEVLKQAPNEVPVWGAFMQKVGEAALPTFREGEIDIGAALSGPGKEDRYSIVWGVRLKDAAAVEKTFRDAVKELPKDAQQIFKLDAATIGATKVHQVMLPPLPEPAKSIFGESTIFVTFRPDAVLVGFGEGAMDGLKEGLAAKPQVARRQYFVEGSGRKLVPLITKIDPETGKKIETFLGKEIDRVTVMDLSIEGGNELKIRYGNGLASLMPLWFLVGIRAEAQFQQIQQAVPAQPAIQPIQRNPAPPIERP